MEIDPSDPEHEELEFRLHYPSNEFQIDINADISTGLAHEEYSEFELSLKNRLQKEVTKHFEKPDIPPYVPFVILPSTFLWLSINVFLEYGYNAINDDKYMKELQLAAAKVGRLYCETQAPNDSKAPHFWFPHAESHYSYQKSSTMMDVVSDQAENSNDGDVRTNEACSAIPEHQQEAIRHMMNETTKTNSKTDETGWSQYANNLEVQCKYSQLMRELISMVKDSTKRHSSKASEYSRALLSLSVRSWSDFLSSQESVEAPLKVMFWDHIRSILHAVPPTGNNQFDHDEHHLRPSYWTQIAASRTLYAVLLTLKSRMKRELSLLTLQINRESRSFSSSDSSNTSIQDQLSSSSLPSSAIRSIIQSSFLPKSIQNSVNILRSICNPAVFSESDNHNSSMHPSSSNNLASSNLPVLQPSVASMEGIEDLQSHVSSALQRMDSHCRKYPGPKVRQDFTRWNEFDELCSFADAWTEFLILTQKKSNPFADLIYCCLPFIKEWSNKVNPTQKWQTALHWFGFTLQVINSANKKHLFTQMQNTSSSSLSSSNSSILTSFTDPTGDIQKKKFSDEVDYIHSCLPLLYNVIHPLGLSIEPACAMIYWFLDWFRFPSAGMEASQSTLNFLKQLLVYLNSTHPTSLQSIGREYLECSEQRDQANTGKIMEFNKSFKRHISVFSQFACTFFETAINSLPKSESIKVLRFIIPEFELQHQLAVMDAKQTKSSLSPSDV